MTVTWYKRYHKTAYNPKFTTAGILAGSTHCNALGVWDALLEECSENEDDRGSLIDVDLRVVAAGVKLALDEVQRIWDAFISLGMIAAKRIVKFAKRQGTNLGSPARPVSAGALRTRQWRRRKAFDERQQTLDLGGEPSVTAAVTTVTQDITPGVTEPVTVTVPKERDLEKESPLAGPPKGARAHAEVIQIDERRGRKGGRGTRLPDDFVVPAEWLEEAAAARQRAHLGRADLAVEAVKFVNHFTALCGVKAVKASWSRAWVNWCLNPIVVSNSNAEPVATRVSECRAPERPLTDEERDRAIRASWHGGVVLPRL